MAEVAKTASRADGIDVQLRDCAVTWLEDRTALIGCASGQLLVATLPLEGGSVRRILVLLILTCSSCFACACKIASGQASLLTYTGDLTFDVVSEEFLRKHSS